MNNPTIDIQEYTAEYQSRVIRLILQIQQQEYQISITGEDQPDLLEIETFYQKGIGNFWIALADEEVVGTIALLDIGEEQAALRKMFVAKITEARNKFRAVCCIRHFSGPRRRLCMIFTLERHSSLWQHIDFTRKMDLFRLHRGTTGCFSGDKSR